MMNSAPAVATSDSPRLYLLRELAVPVAATEPDLAQEIAAFLRIKRRRIGAVRIIRRSLDSRRRNQPLWRYTVEFACEGPVRHPRLAPVTAAPPANPAPAAPEAGKRWRPSGPRIAVIGSGPAGMAAALGLARKGYRVTVFEQGADVGRRFQDIRRFLKGTGVEAFNARSNILFGEGGAGTFSDGKLTCRTRTPYTDAFLADLIACGADAGIAYESHPHIGTDRLQFIIKAMRELARSLGTEFRFDTVVDDILVRDGRAAGVVVAGGAEAFDAVVLAAGHSARQLMEKLAAHGVAMEAKPFAVGVRVEHPQDMVNRRQFGDKVDAGLTGAAEYFLTFNAPAPAGPASGPEGTGAPASLSGYSFCMCPGGVVVPCADAPDGLFTNGMSYSNRAGYFANSAVVVPVAPEDLPALAGPGAADGHPALAGYAFIRDLEVKAFSMGGGAFTFPAQTIKAYMEGRRDEGPFPRTSFPRPLRWADFHELFPPRLALALTESFRSFDRKLPGFIDQGLIIGPESRTSSPLRIRRDPKTLESVSTPGLFPLGEGAGYSGGIVSSGADGLRLADGWEEWALASTTSEGSTAHAHDGLSVVRGLVPSASQASP